LSANFVNLASAYCPQSVSDRYSINTLAALP
jgi:hypothetical protein